MRLYVFLFQAKDLPLKNSYVKLQVGMFKSKTKILKNTTNPVWNQEFLFRVHDVDEEVVVSVFHHEDDSGFFNLSGELMGRVRIPVCSVAAEDNQILPPTWFSIERRPKNGKCFGQDCGKILLSISLHGKGHVTLNNHLHYSNINIEGPEELEASCASDDMVCSKTAQRKIPEGKQIIKAVANRLERLFHKNEAPLRNIDPSELGILSDYEDCADEFSTSCSFEEAMEILYSRDNEQGMPENLQGGILLDQIYVVSTRDLNRFLFAPGSQFRKDLEQLQGTTDVQEGPWEWKSGDTSCLTRVVTYKKSATKLVKAVKATEQQTYITADGQQFSLYASVSTPEVPYGNTFKVELLYNIMPGPELSSGEESSHLIVSWGICFHQNTMIRGMIQGGVRQGLKESFDQFSDLLSKHFKVLDSKDSRDKDHVLANLLTEHQSDWDLALEYFWNFTVVSAAFMVFYVLVHILFCEPGKVNGLEFYGLDLPDSLGELFTCSILFIHLEHVYRMISHFVQARLRRGSDHGLKAQDAGWVLTVALIEGRNIPSLESTGFSDPYVVFTCNGKTKTSSVKLQAQDPQWNEILEFDSMEELPSVLNMEVFYFDGPFDQAASLGHAEINFLKYKSDELADLWVSLEGRLSQSFASKLHLRIFLDNKKGVEMIKEYLTRMGREIGKKLNIRSPHRNSAFQKLFGLPPEEFLISDFTCQLKRKMPLQVVLVLSMFV
ncbi:C2 and GRAM domain-containing protein At5g50170 isoform X3 [Carica papaya]|uniref:C2 and GRAM domain-containing protein At5g50170 isoform X3 n=1 Tax=Carica papaya TaxID=3649 RepID=UPI000B8D093A|nr:C2 and GRAM domain-containing protein At5g50170 isoform X3 [Carica papaya]